MKTLLLSLILLISSLYIISVSFSPDYFQDVTFLSGVDGVTNVTWGDVNLTEEIEEDKEEKEK